MQIDLQDRQQSILFPVCSGELDDNQNIDDLISGLRQIPEGDLFSSEFYDAQVSSLFTSADYSEQETDYSVSPKINQEQSFSPLEHSHSELNNRKATVDVELQNQLDSLLGLQLLTTYFAAYICLANKIPLYVKIIPAGQQMTVVLLIIILLSFLC